MTRRKLPTWKELVREEPALKFLMNEVKRHKPSPGFCANAVWYGYQGHVSIKDRMCRLAGFQAWNPKLRTMEAYDAATDALYNALPDCQHEGGPFGC
jgi:hypothetical protein